MAAPVRPLLPVIVLVLTFSSAFAAVDDDATLACSPCDHFADGIALAVCAGDDGLTLGAVGQGLYEHRGLFQSPIIEAPSAFDAIQFSFSAKVPAAAEVSFLVRAWHDGVASRWYEVGLEGEALFDGAATTFQYRVVMTSGDDTQSPVVDGLFFVFALRNPDAPHDPAEPSEPASHPVTAPPIVERDAWGARPPKGDYATHTVKYLIVHHTSSPTAADFQGAATVRGIQKYHMDDRHWMDIGYHFLIGPDGTIFRGRPETAIGAHCIPNTGKLGISVVGNYMEEHMTDANLAALTHLLAHLTGKHGLAVDHIMGHLDFMSTDCPGTDVYGRLPAIREAVAAFDGR